MNSAALSANGATPTKEAVFSAAILTLVGEGVPVRSAIDAVCGDGASEALISALYAKPFPRRAFCGVRARERFSSRNTEHITTMPKLIGHRPTEEMTVLEENANPADMVKLTWSQACLMPAAEIWASKDTTDKGSRGHKAKRWYRWYAYPASIMNNPRSTASMKAKAVANAVSLTIKAAATA